MAERKSIRIADLLIDEMNPRITTPNAGQREALRSIAQEQGSKLAALAQDIVDNGLSPIDLTLVMPKDGDRNRYIVLEGNRRLSALRALESPDLLDGALPPAVLKKVRTLSKAYLKDPLDEIDCVVVPDRETSQHWIELRHTGQNDGAGTVPWGSHESSRYRARLGKIEPHRELLDRLENDGHISADDLATLKTTNFKRLVESPVVRDKLGIDIRNKRVLLRTDWASAAKALAWVVHNLNNSGISVGEIYTAKQREKYARKIPANVAVKNLRPAAEAVPLADAGGAPGKPAERARGKRPVAKRKALIPRDATLTITDTRIQAIEGELRSIDLEAFPNAVSVLFRVFLELSVDHYMTREKIPKPQDPKLRGKLNLVTQSLVTKGKLTPAQAKPIRAAAQANTFVAASLSTMNEYVHNAAMSPSPTDLRASWDTFQAFVTALWAK